MQRIIQFISIRKRYISRLGLSTSDFCHRFRIQRQRIQFLLYYDRSCPVFRSHPFSGSALHFDILKGFKSCHMDEYKGHIVQTKYLHICISSSIFNHMCRRHTRKSVLQIQNLICMHFAHVFHADLSPTKPCASGF